MESGWMWRIEHTDKINQAYVYSSRHISEDDAREEFLRESRVSPARLRTIHFPSGRYETFWLKNVIAIGNAAAFVEPLESTGLHMVVSQVRALIRDLAKSMLCPDNELMAAYNVTMARRWDDIRDFIAIHYKFNRARASEFWRWCNSSITLGSLEGFVDSYQQIGPKLSSLIPDPVEHGRVIFPPWSMFGFSGYLTILTGMRVPTSASPTISDGERQKCTELWTLQDERANGALTTEEAIEAVHSGRINHPIS